MRSFLWRVEEVQRQSAYHGILSNPAQLLPKDECLCLFRLCGIEEKRISQCTSDYGLFRLLAECMPYLQGHPAQDYCELLLLRLFGIDELLSSQNADHVWRICAERLLLEAITIEKAFKRLSEQADFASKNQPRLQIPTDRCLHISDMPPLSPSLGVSWNAWTKNAKSVLDTTEGDLSFCLPQNYIFVKPALYHIEQLLRSQVISVDQEHLWIAQVLRFLCGECLMRDRKLILRFDCEDENQVASLLFYLRDAVGFPYMIWTAKSWEVREVLWEFQKMPHQLPIEFALHFHDVITKEELADEVNRIALYYPYGRLQLITYQT